MIVKTIKSGFRIKFFQVTFDIIKNENGYEIDENSSIWQNYKSKYFIPGMRVNKTKTEKLCPNFNWAEYKFARLFFNEDAKNWALYGVCMKNREVLFIKIKMLSKVLLIHTFGHDWEEKYWEEVYET